MDGYKKIEDGVVGGYKKMENTVVDGFTKINDKFVVCYQVTGSDKGGL